MESGTKCVKCGLEQMVGGPEEQGTCCCKCSGWWHYRCMMGERRLRKGLFICENCKPTGPTAGMEVNLLSFNPSSNSTVTQRTMEDPRDKEIRELKEMVRQLQRLVMEKAAPAPVADQEVVMPERSNGTSDSGNRGTANPNPGMTVEAPLGNSAWGASGASGLFTNTGATSSCFDRSQWRSRLPQEVLRRTATPAPLTKDQMARRKTMNTVLPEFDGNPLKWLTFVSAYLETAGEVCGFTAGEDMARLRAALRGPALQLVGSQMDNVDNLNGVMATLQLSFGDTSLILSAMAEKVRRLPPLDDQLSNIAQFAGQVDHLRSLCNMMDGTPPSLELIGQLERKLPLRYAEEWLSYKTRVLGGQTNGFSFVSAVTIPMTANLNHLADFLLFLHERTVSLGRTLHLFRYEEEKSTRRKTVMAMQETEDEAVEDSPILAITDRPQPAENGCFFKCGGSAHSWAVCPGFKNMAVKDRWLWTRRFKRCFLCFGRHHLDKCKTTATCNVDDCDRKHHPLLHPMGTAVERALNFMDGSDRDTYLRILPVDVKHGEKRRRVLLLQDSGSTVSLIDESLALDLGIKGRHQPLALSWANGSVNQAQQSQCVAFQVGNVVSGNYYPLEARTYPGLSLPRSVVTKELLRREGLDDLAFECHEEEPPLILLGQDNVALMRTLSSRMGRSRSIVASETPLGYVLEGECDRHEDWTSGVCLAINRSQDTQMMTLLTRFIENEHFGLGPDESVVVEGEDVVRARSLMERHTVRRVDGRYEVSLLWKVDDPVLPNNRTLAEDRFRSFEKKLARTPELEQRVMELMESHLERGYVRKAGSSSIPVGKLNYVPVFNAHNPMKPEKVRLVFDCAAQFKRTSLNDVLLPGPDLTTPLVNVLMRFRTKKVGISGDIQDMYHRVFVREEDRSFQRFLWRDQKSRELIDFEMCVMTFGATCSPSLAQHVKNQNALRFERDCPEAVDAIIYEHYVDDWLGGGATEEEVIQLAKDVVRIQGEAGFTMHKFQSNSTAVLNGIGVPCGGNEVSISVSTILGMVWKTTTDSLSFRFRREKFRAAQLDGSAPPTKREMLRVVMSVYDPLGLVSYITIEARIILREAWREDAGWDDPLSAGIRQRWKEWCRQLATLEDVEVSRWHGVEAGDVELHMFSDASETAIAALCYVVQRRIDGSVTRSLVMAKCLVAPLKTKSIPRLELDAAVLAGRVYRMVCATRVWKASRCVFWTDAKNVLWWIRSSTRRYTSYVANRVSAVLSFSEASQWRWVPTAENPADWGTKWSNRGDQDDLWWNGPDFLAFGEDLWPDVLVETAEPLEVKPLLLLKGEKVGENLDVALVPDVSRISRWLVLVGACARAIKFIAVLKKKIFPGQPLEEEFRRRAESALIVSAQRGLLTDRKASKFLSSLAPFVDQFGVLRMRGRTARAEHLPMEARFPAIVDGRSPVVELLIRYIHQQHGHQNVSTTINELRQKVIMEHMKTTVRRVIAGCRWCAVRRAQPVAPQMSALPLGRVSVFMPSFSFIGIDYFGPLNVLVGRRKEKRYGGLITCLTTRAVYLELVASLSLESCEMFLNSLVTRRGMPLEINSDNAPCFVAAAKKFVGPGGARPRWRFIPPHCPSMGGSWERLVGVTKKALESMDMPSTPTEERLRYCLLMAERLINTRPLTDIATDLEEEECLTPNHFLVGSSNGLRGDLEIGQWQPRESLDKWGEVVNSFWLRFTKEYLPLVSPRAKWRTKSQNIAIGDVVFLCDDDFRRGWQRGLVERVSIDEESKQVREAWIRTADGKIFRRGCARIAKLESRSL